MGTVSKAAIRHATEAMQMAVDNADHMGAACRALCVTMDDTVNKLKSATAALTTLIDRQED